MKYLKFLAFLSLILALPACENIEQTVANTYYDLKEMGVPAAEGKGKGKSLSEKLVEKGGCPQVEIVQDLGTFYDFGSAKATPDNLVSRTDISQQSTCIYGSKSVTIDVKLGFDGALGPAGRTQNQGAPFFSYPYFVAILAPTGKILAKEVFAVPLTYAPGNDRQSHIESLRQIIPVRDQENGANHKVVVGFQLSKDQLAYNRQVLLQRQKAQTTKEIKERKLYNLRDAPPPTADIDATIDAPAAADDPSNSGPLIFAPEESSTLNQ